MTKAGFRRAVPPRWFGIGLSLIVAIGFALYAMDDPGNIPALCIVLGMALFIGASREKLAVLEQDLPGTKTGIWTLVAVCVFLLALFSGGILVKRAYDITWAPLATGFVAGLTIFILSESERRYYLMKAADGIR